MQKKIVQGADIKKIINSMHCTRFKKWAFLCPIEVYEIQYVLRYAIDHN